MLRNTYRVQWSRSKLFGWFTTSFIAATQQRYVVICRSFQTISHFVLKFLQFFNFDKIRRSIIVFQSKTQPSSSRLVLLIQSQNVHNKSILLSITKLSAQRNNCSDTNSKQIHRHTWARQRRESDYEFNVFNFDTIDSMNFVRFPRYLPLALTTHYFFLLHDFCVFNFYSFPPRN